MTPMGFLYLFVTPLTVFVVLFLGATAFALSGAGGASKAARVVVISLLTGVGCTTACVVADDMAIKRAPRHELSGDDILQGVFIGALSTIPLALSFHWIISVWGARRQRNRKATPSRL